MLDGKTSQKQQIGTPKYKDIGTRKEVPNYTQNQDS